MANCARPSACPNGACAPAGLAVALSLGYLLHPNQDARPLFDIYESDHIGGVGTKFGGEEVPVEDKDKAEEARDEYEAMRAARRVADESNSWLDGILSKIITPERSEPKPQGDHST